MATTYTVKGTVRTVGFGYNHSVGSWKSGKLCIVNDGREWRMKLYHDVQENVVRECALNKSTVGKVLNKSQFVLSLCGKHQGSIHVKSNDMKTLEAIKDLVTDILNGKGGTGQLDTPKVAFGTPRSNLTPNQKVGVNTWNSRLHVEHDISPRSAAPKPVHHTASSVMSMVVQDERDTESKENVIPERFTSTPARKPTDFLESGQEKSRESLKAMSKQTTGSFYGASAALSRPYGSFAISSGSGVKKRPGLMPNPESKYARLSDNVDYTWRSKPFQSIISPTTNKQPELQGFSNLGNTCYMNAILQSLFGLTTFGTDLIESYRKMQIYLPDNSLHLYMARLLRMKAKTTVTSEQKRSCLKMLKYAISNTAKRFSGYEQHDAHEFLSQVLDQLKEEYLKWSKSTPSPSRRDESLTPQESLVNPTTQNFEFEVLHSIRCLNCSEVVSKAETFHDLSLDMPRYSNFMSVGSIQDSLDQFFKKELIEYTCEECGGKQSEVTHKFTRLPRVLILHLKRYSYNTVISYNTKKTQEIGIPKYLTLNLHCEEETQPPFPPIIPKRSSPQKSSPITPRHSGDVTRRKLMYTPKTRSPGNRFKRIANAFSSEDDDFEKAVERSKIETVHDDPDFLKVLEASKQDTGKMIDLDEDTDLMKALRMSREEAEKQNTTYENDEDMQLKRAMELSLLECEERIEKGNEHKTTSKYFQHNEKLDRLTPRKRKREDEDTGTITLSYSEPGECENLAGNELQNETSPPNPSKQSRTDHDRNSESSQSDKHEQMVQIKKCNGSDTSTLVNGFIPCSPLRISKEYHSNSQDLDAEDEFVVKPSDDVDPKYKEQVKLNIKNGEMPYSYRLLSIVSHIGRSSSAGHYISDVYDIKKKMWFSFDDSHVTELTSREVLSRRDRTGYIFFYVNKDIVDELEEAM